MRRLLALLLLLGALALPAGAQILQQPPPLPLAARFTTSVTTPLVIGGAGAGTTLTLKSTTGVGTTDAIIFKTGSNGAVEPLRLTSAGFVGMRVSAPQGQLHTAGYPVILGSTFTDATAKFNSQGVAWSTFGSGDSLIINGTTSVRPELAWIRGSRAYPEFAIRQHTTADSGGEVYSGVGTVAPTLTMVFKGGRVGIPVSAPGSTLDIAQAATTGAVVPSLTLTAPAHTAVTASTEKFDVNFNAARTQEWATGALTTQRFHVFQAPTLGFVGASTVTDTATVAITGAPVKGTNATLTQTHGLLIQAGAVSTAAAGIGLTVNAPTGGTANYAAQFLGTVALGGLTSSFPMLKRSSTDLQVRLADDSLYANVDAALYKVGGVSGVATHTYTMCASGACITTCTIIVAGGLVTGGTC